LKNIDYYQNNIFILIKMLFFWESNCLELVSPNEKEGKNIFMLASFGHSWLENTWNKSFVSPKYFFVWYENETGHSTKNTAQSWISFIIIIEKFELGPNILSHLFFAIAIRDNSNNTWHSTTKCHVDFFLFKTDLQALGTKKSYLRQQDIRLKKTFFFYFIKVQSLKVLKSRSLK